MIGSASQRDRGRAESSEQAPRSHVGDRKGRSEQADAERAGERIAQRGRDEERSRAESRGGRRSHEEEAPARERRERLACAIGVEHGAGEDERRAPAEREGDRARVRDGTCMDRAGAIEGRRDEGQPGHAARHHLRREPPDVETQARDSDRRPGSNHGPGRAPHGARLDPREGGASRDERRRGRRQPCTQRPRALARQTRASIRTNTRWGAEVFLGGERRRSLRARAWGFRR